MRVRARFGWCIICSVISRTAPHITITLQSFKPRPTCFGQQVPNWQLWELCGPNFVRGKMERIGKWLAGIAVGSVLAATIVDTGCDRRPQSAPARGAPATTPATPQSGGPSSGAAASANAVVPFYAFDDPRCVPAEQRAIRAATLAVIGTASPSAEMAKELHYNIGPLDGGWLVTVWEFGPNHPPVPGGFTNVILNHDFSVRSVMGGE
jgi:hypothetical protein